MGTAVVHAHLSDLAHGTALLTPREVASLFDVTPRTISRWNQSGILVAERTRGGHRRYPSGPVYELLAFLEGVGEP